MPAFYSLEVDIVNESEIVAKMQETFALELAKLPQAEREALLSVRSVVWVGFQFGYTCGLRDGMAEAVAVHRRLNEEWGDNDDE